MLASADGEVVRVRNIGADVAVGDWVVPSPDGERVAHLLPRHSSFTRRASFAGKVGQSHTIAANIDTVMLVHALTSPPNVRRLERELVLAWDSGALPVVVLTKADLVEPGETTVAVAALRAASPGVDVLVASGTRGDGVADLAEYADGGKTIALLGASGVGKSTLINALIGHDTQRTAEVRAGDGRGRHTTTAAELLPLGARGWLIDTPGVRVVSLWSSGRGIERAFADVFEVADRCRFRDCKHDDEPDCAVRAAVDSGELDSSRLAAMKSLVAEEAALENEQRASERALDKRGARRPAAHQRGGRLS